MESNPKTNEEVEELSQGKRGKNLTWEQSLNLLRAIGKAGKNWEKVLTRLHDFHHDWVDVKDPDKCRTHFNTLNSKNNKFTKLIKPKTLDTKGRSPEEIQVLEAEEVLRVKKREAERDEALKLLKEIESRELMARSGTKHTTDEVHQELLSKGNERKKARIEKLEELQKGRQEDAAFRLKVVDLVDNLTKTVAEEAKEDRALMREFLGWLKEKK